jgi:hypothetical protein
LQTISERGIPLESYLLWKSPDFLFILLKVIENITNKGIFLAISYLTMIVSVNICLSIVPSGVLSGKLLATRRTINAGKKRESDNENQKI